MITDPDAICRLAKSCEEAKQIDPTHYEGRIRARLGILSVRALVHGEVLEFREPTGMTIRLRGETTGLPGSFTGTADINLEEEEGRTTGRYTFTMNIMGRLGELGRPFFQPVAQAMANSFAGKVSAFLTGKS